MRCDNLNCKERRARITIVTVHLSRTKYQVSGILILITSVIFRMWPSFQISVVIARRRTKTQTSIFPFTRFTQFPSKSSNVPMTKMNSSINRAITRTTNAHFLAFVQVVILTNTTGQNAHINANTVARRVTRLSIVSTSILKLDVRKCL